MEQDGSGETVGDQFSGVAVSVEEVGDGVAIVSQERWRNSLACSIPSN